MLVCLRVVPVPLEQGTLEEMESLLNWWLHVPEPAIKLLVACICGLALGIEREVRDKAAGLRTIVLISMGSALYMQVGEAASLQGLLSDARSTPDPTRVGSEVVAGIGFLGAGSIIQSRGAVHGLTTAATIWVAAAVGLCSGVGLYGAAVGTTAGVVLALVLLDPLADRFRALVRHDTRHLRFTSAADLRRVLSFAAGIAVTASLLFGLAPAFSTLRMAAAEGMKGPVAVARGRWGVTARGALIVTQVSVSMALLILARRRRFASFETALRTSMVPSL